jgi:hypothetical protein
MGHREGRGILNRNKGFEATKSSHPANGYRGRLMDTAWLAQAPDRAVATPGRLSVMALNNYFFFEGGAVPEGGPALPSANCGVGAADASGTGGPAAARPTLRPNNRHWPPTGW